MLAKDQGHHATVDSWSQLYACPGRLWLQRVERGNKRSVCHKISSWVRFAQKVILSCRPFLNAICTLSIKEKYNPVYCANMHEGNLRGQAEHWPEWHQMQIALEFFTSALGVYMSIGASELPLSILKSSS